MHLPPSFHEASRRGAGGLRGSSRAFSRDIFWCLFALAFIVGFVIFAKSSSGRHSLGRRADMGLEPDPDSCPAPVRPRDIPSDITAIIRRKVKARILFEDANVIAYSPREMVAPVHFVVAPKKPLSSLEEASHCDTATLGHLLVTARKVARDQGLRNGFRVVLNNGPDALQTVPHLHIHVFGGTKMLWPPGV